MALNEARAKVLQAVLVGAFEDNKAKFGRRLGHRDGSFIGQMLRREKPITEVTWQSICDLHEVRQFAATADPATRQMLEPLMGTFEPRPAITHPGGEGEPSLAQAVSQRHPIVEPRTLVWEDLVNERLEGQFLMAIVGEALSPHYLPGHLVAWEACDSGRPGKAVLLQDADGEFHLRIYEPRPGQSWAGVSAKLGYRELRPEDGVRIVARSIWRSED